MPLGSTYDLRLFLPEGATASIRWVQFPKPRLFHSLTFGTYDARHNLIRINRLLDHPVVPSTFLSYLVYHEHLHSLIRPRYTLGGRRLIHPPEFRRAEALHPHFEEAKRWQKESLFKLQRVYSHGRT